MKVFSRLPPSRTFTISLVGVGGLWIYGAVLLGCLCLVLWRDPSQLDTVNALLGVLSSITLAVAGCTVGGAGGMVARDVASKGSTTSGAQIDAADKGTP